MRIMTSVARIGAVGVALFTAACGSSSPSSGSNPAPASSGAPAPSSSVVNLVAGQTVSVTTAANQITNTPAGSAEVTLIAVKQAASVTDPADEFTATAEPGTQYICLEFKIKNTGQTDLDTYPFTTARWTGQDGQTTAAQIALGVACSGLGMPSDDLTSEPQPRPGQFVVGTDALSIPSTEAGALEFVDRSQAPLFTVRTTH